MTVKLQLFIKSRLCSLINSSLESTRKLYNTTNCKGTLCVRQPKDNVRVKILDDSSYLRVRKAFTNREVSLRYVKGLVNYV